MYQRSEDLSVKAERSQDSGDQLSPVAEDSPKESHFRPGENVGFQQHCILARGREAKGRHVPHAMCRLQCVIDITP